MDIINLFKEGGEKEDDEIGQERHTRIVYGSASFEEEDDEESLHAEIPSHTNVKPQNPNLFFTDSRFDENSNDSAIAEQEENLNPIAVKVVYLESEPINPSLPESKDNVKYIFRQFIHDGRRPYDLEYEFLDDFDDKFET